jgi:hypothetical protein
MVISKNGLTVRFDRDGSNVVFEVQSQSAQATAIIKNNNIQAGAWGLRINKFPSINREEKNFYLRGSEAAKNTKVVIKSFDSIAEAKAAETAIKALIDKVVGPSYEVVNSEKVSPTAARWALAQVKALYSNANANGEAYVTALHRLVTALRGPDNESEAKKKATTKIRQAVFSRAIAQTLKVTGKDEYPTHASWTKGQNPPTIENSHLQEHVNQAWDVLDKAS